MGLTKKQSEQKYKQVKEFLAENPKASYEEIKQNVSVGNKFIAAHRGNILKELRQEGRVTKQLLPVKQQIADDGPGEDKSSTEKEPLSLDKITEALKEIKILLINKGGTNMPVEKEDVRSIIQDWWSGEKDRLEKEITGGLSDFSNRLKQDIPNMLNKSLEPYKGVLEEKLEQRKKQEEENKQKDIEKIVNKAIEPVKQMICDENGNCKLVTKQELEKLKKEGAVVIETGKEPADEDGKFLEEAKKRTYLSGDLLDIILNEPQNDKVAVAKRAMSTCKTKEECEKLRDYICKEHPTLCTLVTGKFEERKQKEEKKGLW